jgi:preprotein translocase subunit SecE
MTEQVQQSAAPMDMVKLVTAIAIIIAGLAGFYVLASWPIWARWLIVLASLGLGFIVALQSFQGRALWQFVQSSRVELRKVVWRDRDAPSTVAVTGMVIVVVVLLTVFFWLVDTGLALLVRTLLDRGS